MAPKIESKNDFHFLKVLFRSQQNPTNVLIIKTEAHGENQVDISHGLVH